METIRARLVYAPAVEDCLRSRHPNTTYVAAAGGHLDCLRFAVDAGFSWHPCTTYIAAAGGHLDCLRFAVDAGCPVNPMTTYAAAAGGHLECMRFAIENGCPWGGTTAVAQDACRAWLETAKKSAKVIGSVWKASWRRRFATFALCVFRVLPRDVAGLVLRSAPT